MILGPNDPRALTSYHVLEEARANTKRWNKLLGISELTDAEQKDKDEQLAAILDIIKDES